MTTPLTVHVSVRIEPTGGYGSPAYKFERTKTLSKNTQQELADFIDATATTIKAETKNVTVLQSVLVEARNAALEASEKMKELEHKSGETEEVPY